MLNNIKIGQIGNKKQILFPEWVKQEMQMKVKFQPKYIYIYEKNPLNSK